MQHNLEGISFEEVVNEAGTSYTSFRATLSPRYKKVWLDISKGYFFLAITTVLFLYLDSQFHTYWWIFIIPFSFATGYILAYLALFIHEAGHFNVHPDKKINDQLSTIFLCVPFGLSVKSYRKIHWQHHLHLGTPQDVEISYFNGLTKLFIAETLTGIHLFRTVLKKGSKTVLNKEQIKQSRSMLLLGFLFHGIILSALAISGNWAFAICWIFSFGIFFPFFATIRQLMEHRDELANSTTDFTKQSHGKISRLFTHTILSSSFGSAGFTRHLIHHWDPQASYTRLEDVENFLSQCTATSSIISSSKTTYGRTFKKLLAAP
jgi:fatty acid desaturase